MSLTLTLKESEDVYIGDVHLVLEKIREFETDFSVDGFGLFTVEANEWLTVTPGIELCGAMGRNSPTYARVIFNAPELQIVRGSVLRDQKGEIQ